MRQSRRSLASAARDTRPNPEVIQLRFVRAQTHLDVAQTLAPGELGKGHAQKLIQTGKALGVPIAVILAHQPPKRVQRQMLHELGEDIATLMHGGSLPVMPPSLAQTTFKSTTTRKRKLSPPDQQVSRASRQACPDTTGRSKESYRHAP
jgi:hypothetical protein